MTLSPIGQLLRQMSLHIPLSKTQEQMFRDAPPDEIANAIVEVFGETIAGKIANILKGK